MGANNVLPTIPSFTAGAPSIADLNNLSYAARFLIDHDVRPTWKFFMFTTAAVGAATWTVVPFDHVAFDSDSVWTSATHAATIVTQGYYRVEACVQPEIAGTKYDFITAFRWTAGVHSPYGASSPAWFGYRGIDTSITGSAVADNSGCIGAITPVPMYNGDTLQVMVYCSAAATLDYNQNTSYTQGRFSCQFTGRWIREGS